MRILKWLDEHFEEWAMVVLLAGISLSLLLQIIMRYVFNAALSWSEEFARYCFVWSTFISIGYSIKKSTMLRIDIVVQYLPRSWRKPLDIFVEFFVLAFFGLMLYNSVFVVQRIARSGQTSPAMGFPMVAIYVSLIVGFILAVARGIQKIAVLLRKDSGVEKINTGRM
jgi:C4-dicarboxylate transporter DctQ subunit